MEACDRITWEEYRPMTFVEIWAIRERLGGVSDPNLLRIIFSGRELIDEVSVNSYDLGHQSVLLPVVITPSPDPDPVL